VSTRELTLGYPGCRNTETSQLIYALHYFGISSIGISGYATTGGLAPGFPGSRNSETYIHIFIYIYAQPISGFPPLGFSRVGFSRLASTWGPHLGTRVLKYRNIITSPHSIFLGFRKSGFRDLRVQGNSPLGIPGN
jgi:hypothetical protein